MMMLMMLIMTVTRMRMEAIDQNAVGLSPDWNDGVPLISIYFRV